MFRHQSPASVSVLVGLLSIAAHGALADDGDDREAEKSKARLEYLVTAAGRFSVISEGINDAEAKLITPALLRWSNPHSSSRDGVLVAYSRGGRPEVLAQFVINNPDVTIHEFEPVSDRVPRLVRDSRTVWTPGNLENEFRPFDDVAAPSENPTIRTTQMRQIARRFKVFDDHGWKETVRHPLRLLTQPMLRYEDAEAGIIDGALFTFALATDPEANLLVEAYETPDGPKWRYSFSAMSIYHLQSYLDDELVWDKPDRRVFCNSSSLHFACPYRREADDISLQGMMPAPNKK